MEYAQTMTATLIIALLVIGLLVAVAKNVIGALGLLSAGLLVQVIPAKESTGVLLVSLYP